MEEVDRRVVRQDVRLVLFPERILILFYYRHLLFEHFAKSDRMVRTSYFAKSSPNNCWAGLIVGWTMSKGQQGFGFGLPFLVAHLEVVQEVCMQRQQVPTVGE
jgi:predicted amidohydrolase